MLQNLIFNGEALGDDDDDDIDDDGDDSIHNGSLSRVCFNDFNEENILNDDRLLEQMKLKGIARFMALSFCQS